MTTELKQLIGAVALLMVANEMAFAQKPTSVSPSGGPMAGGTTVAIAGTNFCLPAVLGKVLFFIGSPSGPFTYKLTNVIRVSPTEITATTPPNAGPGAAYYVAIDCGGSYYSSETPLFTYTYPSPTISSVSPASGAVAGGTAMTITGTGLRAGAAVTFGGVPATDVTVINTTTITAVAPAHAPGAVDIVVTNVDSQKATLVGGFTYAETTAAMSVSPSVLDFGSPISGGSSIDLPLTITNAGEGTLSGWSWSFGGLGNPVGGTCGSAAANPGGLYSLTPGQSCTFMLRFTPSSVGQQGGALSIGMKSGEAAPGTWDATWTGSWTATVQAPPTTGAISGAVTDAGTGAPLAGVTVRFYNAAGSSVGSVTTNASGAYTTSGLATGSYFLRTSNSLGYIDELHDNLPCLSCSVTTGTAVAVVAGATTTGIDFSLSRGARFTGTVTDAVTSLPLASVSVYTYDASGKQAGTNATTDASGVYTTYAVVPGTYYLKTSNSLGYVDEVFNNLPCSGCTVTTGAGLAVAGSETVGGIDFALEVGGTISGTVTDVGTGAPLPNVTVRCYSASGNSVGSVTTNASGVYTTTGLATGTYFLRTSNSLGYVDELHDDRSCPLGACRVTEGAGVDVTVGAETSGVDFSLVKGGTIAGTVTATGSGAPLAGVSVTVYIVDPGRGYWGSSSTTDASGAYTRTGLPTGTYFLRTSNNLGYMDELFSDLPCPGGACSPYTNGTGVSVSAGEVTSGIDFGLAAGGTITGTVTAAATGAPLANVTVYVYNASNTSLGSVTTNALGVFTKTGLATGTYYVLTSNSQGYVDELYDNLPCAGGSCSPYTNGAGVGVAAGATTTGIDFALAVGGTITGTVTAAATGTPLANVTVYVYNASNTSLGSMTTDALGIYARTGLPAGTYYLKTTNSLGYVDEIYNDLPCVGSSCTVTNGTGVAVTAGATTTGIDFALATVGTITGTVTAAATGAPLANVTVDVYNASNSYLGSVTTNALGVYAKTGLPTGTYYLKTTNSLGYVDELYNDLPCAGGSCSPYTNGAGVGVTAGATTTGIDFALAAGGTITGTVTAAGTGAPLAGVSVYVYNTSGNQVGSGNTNALGIYTTLGLSTGTYYVRTSNRLGYVDELYNDLACLGTQCPTVTTGAGVAVTAGATTTGIDFVLAVGGTITGTVTAAGTGAPLAGVNVWAYNAAGTQVGFVSTNALGVFTTGTGLPTGAYYVRTSNSQGYVDELYNDLPCVGGSCSPFTNGAGVGVTAGAATTGIDFALAVGGTITGTVTAAATGAPLANVTVHVYNASNTSLGSVKTNALGVFTKTGLATGTYFVRTSSSLGYVDELYNDLPCVGGSCSPYTNGAAVAVTAGATTTGIDFALAVGGTITGTVTGAATGAPVPNVSIYTFDVTGNLVGGGVTTNATGAYVQTGLMPGSYYLRTANNVGYLDEIYNDLPCNSGQCPPVITGVAVVVTAGSTADGADFGLSAGVGGASISVLPGVLDFGPMIVGSGSVDRPLSVTNTGNVTLSGWYWTLNTELVGGTCGSVVANPGGLYSLAPGQSCTFMLRFTPDSLGQHTAPLWIGMRSPSAPAGEPDVTWNGSWAAFVGAQPSPPPGGDFSGDRTSDILWRHTANGDMWLWGMENAAHATDAYVGIVADPNWEIRAQGDLDGDGTADLLWRHKLDGTVYYWRMSAGAPASEHYVSAVDIAYDIVGTGDFDGDGKADILWRNPVVGDLWLWRMNGAEVLEQKYVDTVDLGYGIQGLGDVNGDLRTDIVWQGGAGDVWAWLMNGAVREAPAYVGTVADATYQIEQVADFDADLKADLLWRNAVQGDLWIWRLDGGDVLSEHYVGIVSDTDYRIQAAGDYNGDGKADILWRHAVAGDLWVWLMNGPVRESEHYVGLVADQGYQVVR